MATFPSKLKVQQDLSSLRNAIVKSNKDVIVSLKRMYEQYLPSEMFTCSTSTSLKRDLLSACILPRDIPSNLVPIKTTGNGDCLYNSFSICLMGNENLSGVLRLLTTVEMYQNSQFYASHPRYYIHLNKENIDKNISLVNEGKGKGILNVAYVGRQVGIGTGANLSIWRKFVQNLTNIEGTVRIPLRESQKVSNVHELIQVFRICAKEWRYYMALI